MHNQFAKLYAQILTSTIWQEPDATRLVWITLLALKDEKGYVGASVPGLAHVARVSMEDCEAALAKFEAPDDHSRTKDFAGRRIEVVDGGWIVLNADKYREKQTPKQIANAERVRRFREKKALQALQPVTSRHVTPYTYTDTDTDTDTEKAKTTTLSDKEPESFAPTWKAYPKRSGGNARADALKAYKARLREGVPAESLMAGVYRYAVYVRATGKEGSEYVKLGATFFGPSRHWEEPWTLTPTTAVTERNGKPGSSLAAAELIQRVKKATVPNPYGGGMQLTADWQSTFSEPELRVIRAITPGRILNDENPGTLLSQMTKALEESNG